ncbi:TetR/AcrR family transcriptional regulator [Rhodococcus sp. NPDC078407]|uniref:TetR/AcrR family transcriptional regulator n=1 Tax=Rhodococcus sp. NPDC078407 TaxID=3364509 RepID=UPI0037C9030E
MASKKDVPFDPARTLELLWRVGGKPSRTGLSVDAIVDAAIELADANGLEFVSMRNVAERLGVGAMSLYTHVPGREELTDLMIDRSLSGLYSHVDEPSSVPGGWRPAMRFVAERNWVLYQQHSWLLEVEGARPVLGPHTNDKYEAELRPLVGTGLTDIEIDSVLTLVLTHVCGTARALAGVTRVKEQSGMTDAQWWSATAPILERVMDRERFPVSSRVGTAAATSYDAASDPVHAYLFGLERILDGVQALMSRDRPVSGDQPADRTSDSE